MIIIGLGSNLISNIGNNPQKNCQLALEKMREVNIFPIKVSSFFESAPLPVSTQPWFVNLAVSVKTELDPHKLLNVLLSIESEMGRKRGGKNAPRVIDLDILVFNNMIIKTENLVLPHPRIVDRAFVLYPIQELNPSWQHPVSGKNIANLISNLGNGQLIRVINR